MFHILSLATGEPVCDAATGEPETFETGAEAAKRAKELAEANPLGGKFQPRKVPLIDDRYWHIREGQRFISGEYTAPNAELLAHCQVAHYVHVSLDKPALLAYTASEEKGRADIQRRRSVVGYLEEFAPYLSKEERERIAAEHIAAFSVGVKFAVTPDEIEAVYTNYDESADGVSNSCMRHKNAWDGPEHPVRVYGDSDLQVAYLTNDEGKTTHRALIWPEKKVYSRVYGDSSSFHAALKSLGYVKSSGYYGPAARGNPSLKGARVRVIEADDRAYVMPYIDECDTVGLRGEWFVLGGDGYKCHGTDGVTENSGVTCERCDDEVDEDNTYTVYTSTYPDGRERSSERWCAHCYENHSFYCEGVDETFSDDVDSAEADNGRRYTVAYLEAHAHLCDHTEEWTFDDLSTVIIDASSGETEQWGETAVANDAFVCTVTGQIYSHDCARDGTLEKGGAGLSEQGTRWRGVNDEAPEDDDENDDDDEAETLIAAE